MTPARLFGGSTMPCFSAFVGPGAGKPVRFRTPGSASVPEVPCFRPPAPAGARTARPMCCVFDHLPWSEGPKCRVSGPWARPGGASYRVFTPARLIGGSIMPCFAALAGPGVGKAVRFRAPGPASVLKVQCFRPPAPASPGRMAQSAVFLTTRHGRMAQSTVFPRLGSSRVRQRAVF